MAQVQLAVDVRTEKGKGVAHRLRSQGLVPAVLYGGKMGNLPLTVNTHDLLQIVAKGAWETTLIDLMVPQKGRKKAVPVLIKELQIDPVKRTLLHADFLEITMGHAIEVHIPLEIVGESPGVKAGGVMEFLLRELTVECLPSKMVDHFSVDVSALEVGDSLAVGDLSIGGDFKILNDEDTMVLTVVAPTVQEEEEAEEEEEALEPELIQKGKKEEEEEE